MSPSGTSPDVRAVVRALDALTTQVKRLANHTANPASFGLAPPVADDRDTPTTPVSPDFTSPLAGRIEVRKPCPYCGDRQMIPTHQYDEHVARLHPDVRTGGPGIPVPPVAGPPCIPDHSVPVPCPGCDVEEPDAEGAPEAAACRRMETRTCPPSYNGPCGERPCARFESDDPTPWQDTAAPPRPATVIGHWLPMTEQQRQEKQELAGMVGEFIDAQVQQARADEDAQRTTRRERLLNLLARLQRGGMTAEEKVALRQHVEAEIREADTARSVAAGNKRHVQTLVPELGRLTRENEQLLAEQAACIAAERRADIAERELRVLRSGLRANGADPTQIQNLWAQIRLRNRQWRDTKRELAEAQAAIDRVRRVCADPVNGFTVHSQDVLAALDGAEQPTTESP